MGATQWNANPKRVTQSYGIDLYNLISILDFRSQNVEMINKFARISLVDWKVANRVIFLLVRIVRLFHNKRSKIIREFG